METHTQPLTLIGAYRPKDIKKLFWKCIGRFWLFILEEKKNNSAIKALRKDKEDPCVHIKNAEVMWNMMKKNILYSRWGFVSLFMFVLAYCFLFFGPEQETLRFIVLFSAIIPVILFWKAIQHTPSNLVRHVCSQYTAFRATIKEEWLLGELFQQFQNLDSDVMGRSGDIDVMVAIQTIVTKIGKKVAEEIGQAEDDETNSSIRLLRQLQKRMSQLEVVHDGLFGENTAEWRRSLFKD